MRLLAASALAVCALLAAVGSAPAAAQPRAMIAFIPTEPAPKHPLLFDVAERGMAFGMTSPTLGEFSKRQMALDISQGSRVSARAYPEDLERLDLVRGARGARIAGWERAVERADDAPGDVVPGLLAEEVKRSGRSAGYAGIVGFEQVEAVVAADREGRIDAVSLGTFGTFVERALRLWRDHDLVVARFPGDARGLEALDRVLAARGPDDLVYVMRAPPGGALRFLPTGIAGPGFDGTISSDTTRQAGLVAATDVAPTVLEHLGVGVPDAVDGQRVDAGGGGSAEDVRERIARLDIVFSRRGRVLSYLFLGCVIMVGILAFARRDAGLRTGLRVSFLAVLWMPGVALVTAAIAPGYQAELFGTAAACLVLGGLTDRLVRWPAAPAVPAAIVFAAHAVDLAYGSPLIGASILGPNPEGGARFYGIGNELESILAVMVLLGVGAALTIASTRHPGRVFGAACLVAAVVIGAGRLGADVGGVVTLGAGAAGAILALQPGGPSRRAIALAVAAPAAALVGLIALDVLTGGGAHLTRTILEAEGSGDVLETIWRRVQLSAGGLVSVARLIQVGVCAALVVWAIRNRERVYAPIRRHPAFTAGMVGALSATVVGALANDSGPVIFITGAVMLLLATGYVIARPQRAATPSGGQPAEGDQIPIDAPPVRLR